MHLTKGQAKIAVRLCKYLCAASLLGIVCLLATGSEKDGLPAVVGFSETAPPVGPVVYKQFAQLRARLDAPFSFQDQPVAKRSYLVNEKADQPPPPPPEPELDTDELTLMAIFNQKGKRYAALHDLRDSKIIKVKVGETVRGAKVAAISKDKVVLRLSGKNFELSWSRPWQQLSNE